ncbi:zinc-binding dehydrogenase [Streptomyces sp. NPDC058463]|uniref:zinc-binding dehydrogenase n=1 Tax=Streptomyces sp. NPDC058463 TaxID=3346510 RepID=UPI0036551546
MRALVVDHSAPSRLTMATVPDPEPGPDEVLVKVVATSLNYGELPRDDDVAEGSVPGWDAAGIVEKAAASGRGPRAGQRLVTWGWSGGWAQLRAVSHQELAVLPDELELSRAAALPVAGLTALRALRKATVLPGQRVAITGASGGVGHFAVQLAHLAGAEVYALSTDPTRAGWLTSLGADHVLTHPGQLDSPLDLVLDNVGGDQLAEILGHMNTGGTVISIGATSAAATTFQPYQLVQASLTITGLQAGGDTGNDLAHLAAMAADGRLTVGADTVSSWENAPQLAADLIARRIRGKAVLTVD